MTTTADAGLVTDRNDAILEVENASFGYGNIPIVRHLSLTVHAGQVVALLGANGAGKTTTLLGVAGELRCAEGTVRWLGRETKAPLHVRAKQGLGFVPGEQAITPSLNVRDNLRLGRGTTDAALELFPELRPMLRRQGGLLSGGEQKMLSMARAVAARPRLLLVDEISQGLAPLATKRLLAAVRRAADEFGVGVLLVEQQVRQALDLCDRAYVMRRGEIVMEGAGVELGRMMHEIEAHYLDESIGSPNGSRH